MFDLASIAQLFSEWSTLCRNEATVLPPIDITFRDYVMALEQAAGTAALQAFPGLLDLAGRNACPAPGAAACQGPRLDPQARL